MMRFFLTVVLFTALGLATTLAVATLVHADPSVQAPNERVTNNPEKAGAAVKPSVDKQLSIIVALPPALTAGR